MTWLNRLLTESGDIAPILFVGILVILVAGFFFRKDILRSPLRRIISYLGNFDMNHNSPPTTGTAGMTGPDRRTVQSKQYEPKAAGTKIAKRAAGGKHNKDSRREATGVPAR